MTRTHHTRAVVLDVLDAVANDHPDRIDRRPAGDLPPRYIDHGDPACLVALVMNRLGVSIGVLRAMDRENVRIAHSRHPVRRRFTADAWGLLAALQWDNDRAWSTWGAIRDRLKETP